MVLRATRTASATGIRPSPTNTASDACWLTSLAVPGAMQIGANGDLANWSTGDADAIPAVGGAMDLVAGVPNVLAITEHTTRDGEPKLVERCTYPLTGVGVVTRIYTNLAVVDVADGGFVLRELAPGVDLATVRSLTGGPLRVDGDPPEMRVP